ncbi:hypothetical protein P9D51_04260 [Bacillus sonorensis]|uniref:hypothetical protein n=1 Tax=Bacillus sonorensis TaxID=119858 RepID=UPI002DB931CA|nr:hypothetical protein [Bacillus sonorensis]MEC1354642.1 hypothetical protein [Bacillus sonorensis]MEC1425358.1 hypothetical protein [Bacillus sonorensis]
MELLPLIKHSVSPENAPIENAMTWQALGELLNYFRKWMLKGHTPKEIFQRRKLMIDSSSVHPLPSSNVLDFMSLDHAEVGIVIRSVAGGGGEFGVVSHIRSCISLLFRGRGNLK